MDWVTRLAGKLPGGVSGWPTLAAHLAAMNRREAAAVTRALLDAWLRGELELGEWERLTGVVGEPPLRHVHVLWDRLVEADLARKEIVHHVPSITSAVATRWAWTPRWQLYDQDEDILLFGHEHAQLDAIGPDCPKRAHVLEIVAHAVRDAAHGSVVLGTGRDGLALAAELLPRAQAQAPELAAYLARLASYRRPARVSQSGATARGQDLGRCHPPGPGEMTVRAAGDRWEIRYREAGFTVRRATGRMEPLAPARRAR